MRSVTSDRQFAGPCEWQPGMLHVKHTDEKPANMSEYLGQALIDLGSVIDARVLDLLARHWALVAHWNQRTNLTAIVDPAEAAWLHYRDCLESLKVLPQGALVDVGSGAGFPGLPIAIVEPTRPITLLEPRRKRASFLQVAVAELGLVNVNVLQCRMEKPPDHPYDAAITRATFSDPADLERCLTWVKLGGTLVAMRTGAPNPGAAGVHTYELRGEPRHLEIWRR